MDPARDVIDDMADEIDALNLGGGSQTNLFVANLPDDASDDSLRNMFSTFGNIVSCKVMIDFNSGKSRGFGFVKFEDAAQAQHATQVMNGVTYESKTLTVKPANSNEPNQTPTNNVYVKGLPISFTKQNLEAMFSRFGPILESRILTDANTGFSRGIGFVRFETVEQATAAIREMNNQLLPGTSRPVIVKYADTEDEKLARRARLQTKRLQRRGFGPGMSPAAAPAPPPLGAYALPPQVVSASFYSPAYQLTYAAPVDPGAAADTNTLYVSSLPPDADDAAVYKLFSTFGNIQSAKVIRDHQTNASRGFGFVRFTNYQDAFLAAQSLNGTQLQGRPLAVAFKAPSRGKGPTAAMPTTTTIQVAPSSLAGGSPAGYAAGPQATLSAIGVGPSGYAPAAYYSAYLPRFGQ